MNSNSHKYFVAFCMMFVIMCSCKKYLDKKSDQSLATPDRLSDLQAMLYNQDMNIGLIGVNSSSDEYYLKFSDWQSSTELDKDAYIWDPNLNNLNDWFVQYRTIFYANSILDNLAKISPIGKEKMWDEIKGSSLFFRAYSYHLVAQLYAPQYDPVTGNKDFGIVLRSNSDFNDASSRATVQQSFNQILSDLELALALLPDLPEYKTQPSKVACYALLARVLLQMGNYNAAKQNADACLLLQNQLLNFNDPLDVNISSSSPIKILNKEVVFYTNTNSAKISSTAARVDSVLYKSYDANDLRKTAYFYKNSDNSYSFKGSYNGGSTNIFNGLATDEIYLIRAECNARLGAINDALQDLNTLLAKRWKNGTFSPVTTSSASAALRIILEERRKELFYRGLRWSDLRRLNKDSNHAVTISRNLNNQVYSISPNDLRYTFLIPQEVVSISFIPQNSR